jgi:hypothetical protein
LPVSVASGSASLRSATSFCAGVNDAYSALPASTMSSTAVSRLRDMSASASRRFGAVVSLADTRGPRFVSSSMSMTRAR